MQLFMKVIDHITHSVTVQFAAYIIRIEGSQKPGIGHVELTRFTR